MEIKRYYSFSDFSLKEFGYKLYKIPLNAGFTCPNRDGKISYGGCIFCASGSGDFSSIYDRKPISLDDISFLPKHHTYEHFIGYFQAFTNTYADIETLEKTFHAALNDPLFEGISIATRPDCIDDKVINLLNDLKSEFPNKFIWIELGLQTTNDSVARWMNRGYETEVFTKCVKNLKASNIPVIVHVIIGLPEEYDASLIQEMKYLNDLHIDGIKLQLLHILKETRLAKEYEEGKIQALSLEEYVHRVGLCISYLEKDIVIHRITGDGNKELLIAPTWSLNKRNVLNRIHQYLKEKDITQGCCLK